MSYLAGSGVLSFSNITTTFGVQPILGIGKLYGVAGGVATSGIISFSQFQNKFGPPKSGLQFWVDAASTHTITKDGSNKVSQWSDKSGNNYHVTQATAGNQPTYSATGFTGSKPTLTFANTNALQRATSTMGTAATSSSASVYVVSTRDGNSWDIVTTMWFNSTGGTTTTRRYHFSLRNNNTNDAVTLFTNGALASANGPTVSGSDYIAGFVHAGANMLSSITNNGVEYSFTPTTDLNASSTDTYFEIGDIRNANVQTPKVSEVLIYDRALTSAERASLFTYLGWKWGINVMMMDKLSAAGKSALQGAFSLKRLSIGYTGPTINVRRGSDNATSDFYADPNGNLGQGINGSGTSLSSWLNGATGYITTWYDQSGVGNHATQTTTGSQPTVDLTYKWINFNTNAYFNLPNGTVPYNNTNYTFVCRHNTIGSTIGGYLGSGNYGTNNQTNTIRRGNTGYYNYWFNADIYISSGYADGNVVTFKYDGANRYGYLNGTLTQTTASTNRASTSANNTLGAAWVANNEYMNGEMYYLYIFNSALSDADRIIAESDRLNLSLPVTSGLYLWLDAADTSSFTLSSNNVSEWRDKSGNNRHFSQATSTAQPVRNTQRNSAYVVTFDGTKLLSPASTLGPFNTSGATIIVVAKPSSTGYHNFYDSGSSYPMLWYRPDKKLEVDTGSTIVTTNTYENVWFFSVHTVGTTNAFYLGETYLGATQAPSANALTVWNRAGGQRFIGDFAEMIIFNRVITAAERTSMNTYLKQKWGL